MKKLIPWLVAIGVGVLCSLARYVLIQPPEFAHQCDAIGGAWCTIRTWVIYTYAWYGLGYAALVLCVVALIWQRVWTATLVLCTGIAALILYCYEPGALALVIGTLLVARNQSRVPQSGTPKKRTGSHANA